MNIGGVSVDICVVSMLYHQTYHESSHQIVPPADTRDPPDIVVVVPQLDQSVSKGSSSS
jgi:hypothetical protein